MTDIEYLKLNNEKNIASGITLCGYDMYKSTLYLTYNTLHNWTQFFTKYVYQELYDWNIDVCGIGTKTKKIKFQNNLYMHELITVLIKKYHDDILKEIEKI